MLLIQMELEMVTEMVSPALVLYEVRRLEVWAGLYEVAEEVSYHVFRVSRDSSDKSSNDGYLP